MYIWVKLFYPYILTLFVTNLHNLSISKLPTMLPFLFCNIVQFLCFRYSLKLQFINININLNLNLPFQKHILPGNIPFPEKYSSPKYTFHSNVPHHPTPHPQSITSTNIIQHHQTYPYYMSTNVLPCEKCYTCLASLYNTNGVRTNTRIHQTQRVYLISVWTSNTL